MGIALPEHEARRQALLLQQMKLEAIAAAAEDIGIEIPLDSPVDLWPMFLCRGLLIRIANLEEVIRGFIEVFEKQET